ncbi:helix-turn-helix domain-containing protein [Kordiimonas sediminis]|nr:helix-turn-helix domain-containing protein [Kordiimonas sediminis]
MSSKDLAASLAIGDRIHNRRKELGLTLQLLAKTSGLSASFISLAERNKTVPSLMSLMTLSKALGVSIEYFTEAITAPNPIKKADDPQVLEDTAQLTVTQLSNEIEFGQNLDVLKVRLAPKEPLPIAPKEGEIFLYVLDGSVRFENSDLQETLTVGDSFHIDARVTHTVVNAEQDKDTVLLYACTPSRIQR